MSLKKQICQSCQIVIQPGESFYNCRVEFSSGNDGFYSESFDPETAINDAIKQLEGKSSHDIMKDVYHEIILCLCPDCRKKLENTVSSMITHTHYI